MVDLVLDTNIANLSKVTDLFYELMITNVNTQEIIIKLLNLILKKHNISDMKTKSPKLSKEALTKIWQATRPNVYKNKKKYSRKKYAKK